MIIENIRSNISGRGGFTLIEIMVVIGFFVFMSAGVAISVNKFSSHINLTNLAYEMAATIRQAQTYGVSVAERSRTGYTACDYQSAYGIVFYSTDQSDYVMFADDPKDCVENPTTQANQYNRRCGAWNDNFTTFGQCKNSTEFLKSFHLGRGNYISKFCAVRDNNTEDCSNNGLTYMAISFIRPNPEATIRTSVSDVIRPYDVPTNIPAYKEAYIEISTPGSTKTSKVYVSITGYISPRGGARGGP
ncbi:MAG: prepilin-type N-terminal cleavage/methylation domain-containing protein [Candidatus Taylorbacteria bacterium]|nr:prepilin-type N-terminal cleavage/methylation domain-containing protein [Candidatus Taylorbacteria bacterium]